MGNQPSMDGSDPNQRAKETAERVKKMVGDVGEEIKRSVRRLEEDPPQFLDNMCGWQGDDRSVVSARYNRGSRRQYSAYSEDDYTEDGSRTLSEDETTYDDRSRRSRADQTEENQSYMSEYGDTEDERTEASSAFGAANLTAPVPKQPLASSFAKRCYFTKAGIGRNTQHYEGLTLTGNVVLMLASAMKLKGCPTICDEDLRRVEQTFPNQFSRLPDELLLSSGWRRVSKYCHFSNKPIPDGVPFFHSKQRLHPSGGYYFLLAAAVGMSRPIDVEPLTKDTLVLLETDYPSQCDTAPGILVRDPEEWTLVDKFCFFSGGPINTEEDVYYQADFDGNPIFMLAFLSPSLTPDELYKLGEQGELSLKTVAAVQEVESVYDLTERDFDDLKLYHLGPCRALPQYILSPHAWVKVLPPHFLEARQQAFIRAEEYMQQHGIPMDEINGYQEQYYQESNPGASQLYDNTDPMSPGLASEYRREMEEEGAFYDEAIPMDERHGGFPTAHYYAKPYGLGLPRFKDNSKIYPDPTTPRLDPPDDEPPSLQKGYMEYAPQETVPDPEDPSVVMTPSNQLAPGGQNQRFFSGSKSISKRGPQQHSVLLDPNSPEDEHRSGDLINQVSVEEQAEAEYDSFSNHLKPPPGEFGPEDDLPPYNQHQEDQLRSQNIMDPLYSGNRYGRATVDDYGGEEKKIGIDEHVLLGSHLDHQKSKDGEEVFVPIKRDGLQLEAQEAISPSGGESVGSHKSAAFRSAQDLLRKNRRRRQEETVSHQMESGHPPLQNPGVPSVDLQMNGTWDSTSDVSGSNVSGSSLWSENSGADRNSRRALILQMAKARMRNNKDSPSKSMSSPDYLHASMIEEEGASMGGQSEPNTEIDIAGDLD